MQGAVLPDSTPPAYTFSLRAPSLRPCPCFPNAMHERTLQGVQSTGNARAITKAATLTAVMMSVEIAGGWAFNSMALLADGWHMSSHVLVLLFALSIAWYAERNQSRPERAARVLAVELIAASVSAMIMLWIAASMAYESTERLHAPEAVQYSEALAIAVAGLITNIFSARWLHSAYHREGAAVDHCHVPHERHADEKGPMRAGVPIFVRPIFTSLRTPL